MKRIHRLKSKGIFFLYRLLQAALFPLVCFYFLLRCLRKPEYFATIPQRLGSVPREYHQTVTGAIWFHAVSVGEVIAVAPLIDRVRERYPCAEIYLTTSTLAGYRTATTKLSARILYAPIDYVFAVRRMLRAIRPSLLIVAETEIWPHLFRETARTGCPILIVNGRISDRAAPRYRRFHWFFRHALAGVDRILVQSVTDLVHYLAAGAPTSRTSIGGNLKYDSPPRDTSDWLRPFANGSRLWIAASTTAGDGVTEEEIVLQAFRRLAGWKLVLAPRKPDRFEEVAALLTRAGIRFSRRSRGVLSGDVLLLDTIGELAGLFPAADAVFMGGSLANRGGHNILEPAFFAKPIIVGPHMENFRDVAQDFRSRGAFVEIQDGSALANAVLRAASDATLGPRAQACAEFRRGASEKALQEISRLYEGAVPRYRRSLPALLALAPLAALWRLFRRRPVGDPVRLGARLISIGNITVGGTGKTPLVLYIAKKLAAGGRRPGILMRGHGRASPHKLLLLPAGSRESVFQTGDEAQIFLRAKVAPVGIGADRVTTGRHLSEQFGLDTLLLDDGFQQLRLARDLDIVLIDAMQPFGDEAVLPLGRLREPLSALSRASAFVISRTECNRPTRGIEARLRSLNSHAPIFHSRVAPLEWVDQTSGETYPAGGLPFQKTLAFCGLGNPHSFWMALQRLGIQPAERLEFGDHHQYSAGEIRRMGMLVKASHLEALLTTEKDVVNLCESTDAIVAPAKIFWLKIGLEIDDEPGFLRFLEI